MWVAPQDSLLICFEEIHVFQFELHGLLLSTLCSVALSFHFIFAYAQEVIICDKGQVPNCLCMEGALFTVAHFD
jgi:hypothetical protein